MNTAFINRLFEQSDDYVVISWLFIKLVSVIYAIAFMSMSVQITGLVGEHGILPFSQVLEYMYQQQGTMAWLLQPNIFWIKCTDTVLLLTCYAGVVLSVCVLTGIAKKYLLIILFILYLSLFHAGQIFLSFQWDSLLLEAGFLSILLAISPVRLVIFLFHWLLFRLRFMSGVAKLASGDPSWLNLQALNYYFETEPLPHIGSWYFHQLPVWMHESGVVLMFFSELIVPLFIFLPRKFRLFAAGMTLMMQLLIIASSNHNWINLLTICLCLFLLDDKLVKKWLPSGVVSAAGSQIEKPGYNTGMSGWPLQLFKGTTALVAALMITVSILAFSPYLVKQSLPGFLADTTRVVNAWGMGFSYHVFPTMQIERQELQIEGSYDGQNWQAYQFRYKPGPLNRTPVFNVPHQPRLDWMIWFVPPQFGPMMGWFGHFLDRLHEGRPEVTALLEVNPFEDKPPEYLRVLVFDYHFTTPEEREKTGNWWKATYLGVFPYVKPRYP